MKPRVRATVKIIISIIGLAFTGLACWEIGAYATDMVASGEIAFTTKVPIYPFVYLIAFGFLTLFLVLLSDVVHSVRKVVGK